MNTIYVDGEYLRRNPTWHAEGAAWKAGHVLSGLKAAGLHPKTICDVGCGAGGALATIHAAHPDISLVGIDISPQAIDLAKASHPEIDFRVLNSIAPWNLPHFDVVLALDVLEHVEDYYGFLRSIHAAADVVIFHIPLDWSVESTLRPSKTKDRRNGPGHLHYFNKDTALESLAWAGYKIRHWHFTHPPDDMYHPSLARRLLMSACKLAGDDVAAKLIGGYSLLVVAA